jgi:hypothetical protein
VLAVAGGAWLTLYAGVTSDQPFAAGHQACLVALIGVSAALAVGRLVDALVARPRIAASARRGWPGLVIGVVAGCALGAWYGSRAGLPSHGHHPAVIYAGRELMSGGKGALIALVAAGVAVVVDLGIDAGMTTLSGDRPAGAARRPAPWPARLVVAGVLPVLVAAPAAYVVSRVVLT